MSAMLLTAELIPGWADVQRAETGKWPRRECGVVVAAPTETWYLVDSAMVAGTRGLPGSDSVAKLLARKRGVRYARNLPGLSAGESVRGPRSTSGGPGGGRR
ncbi:hypothetical protein PX52LOC_03666 [Limnoglobus roseus]|uniref:Uncharacterized protein n=1 Tax=Limnoglobus roseus TaxID=2598579 RepID=A0A5C1AES5_9BACT|nr:hypothetical protein PX52LOC_03666 [Limnoglobus roseus]